MFNLGFKTFDNNYTLQEPILCFFKLPFEILCL